MIKELKEQLVEDCNAAVGDQQIAVREIREYCAQVAERNLEFLSLDTQAICRSIATDIRAITVGNESNSKFTEAAYNRLRQEQRNRDAQILENHIGDSATRQWADLILNVVAAIRKLE